MAEPQEFLWKSTLRNGVAVTIRALRSDDRERVAAAVRRLDPESIYSRLFSYRTELSEAGLDRIMTADPRHEVALLVTSGIGVDETVIGSGRCIASDAPGAAECTAEVAFLVAKDYQGLGIAGLLLARLVEIGRKQGITRFEADVLAGNKSMLAVFARSGLQMQQRRDGGVIHVSLSLAASGIDPAATI
jgi:GNAT superfamily N-acetyltransferase